MLKRSKIKRSIHLVGTQNNYVVSFDKALEKYINYHQFKNSRDHTIIWLKSILIPFGNYLRNTKETELLISDITKNEIQDYLLYLKDIKGNKPITINGKIEAIKLFFSYLKQEGLTNINPAASIQKIKYNETVIQTFTPKQLDLLLQQPNINTFVGLRDKVIMIILMDTAVRINELMSVKVNDLIWDEFYPSSFYVHNPKARRERIADLPRASAVTLKNWLDERKKYSVDSEWLFPNIYGEQLKNRTIQQNIKSYGKTAGIVGVRVSPHTFRHTFAKNYIMQGGDIVSLKEILGHATIDMTAHYGKLFSPEVRIKHQKFCPSATLKLSI